MATHVNKFLSSVTTRQHQNWHRGFINPFWSKVSYTKLEYTRQPFNNVKDLKRWQTQGYTHEHFTGLLCDINADQPKYTNSFVEWFAKTFKAKHIGVSYYKMPTGVILPTHKDTFKKYRSLFKCSLKNCVRAIIFLDDWQPGHFFEIDGNSITNYKKGDYIFWSGSTPHMAANIGLKDRYTLQITGHK
tara:strand:- start:1344 stop:1907 length:564 start_codon:yes stop_codon:yes gene_type:complete